MLRAFIIPIALMLWLQSGLPAARAEALPAAPDAAPAPAVPAAPDAAFGCAGPIEEQVWSMWDRSMRSRLEQELVQARLLKSGDVFALYDLQTYAHNLVSMARRCGRTDRLRELAQLAEKAYAGLAPGTIFSPGRRWICRGGRICNESNGLLGAEVVLNSVQFLAMAAAIANAIATSNEKLGPDDARFIKDTAAIATEHLLRWGDIVAIYKLSKIAAAKPADIVDGSSELLFTDQPLWMIALYAELAGILAASGSNGTALSIAGAAGMRPHLAALLRAFAQRISYSRMPGSRIGDVEVADIDRGYWSSYADNLFAGYEGAEKPVTCARSDKSKSGFRLIYHIRASAVARRADIGWDFSHARRLVHAMDAIERNRNAMQTIFSLADADMPARELPMALANNLVAVVWNGSAATPLFSNYWGGANGWFRVAYDNGAGSCNEGYPPYGLSDSFATGGYVAWAGYRQEIGQLGKSLYALASDPGASGAPFIGKYYSGLSGGADQDTRAFTTFMFLPTLVGVGIR